MRLPAHAFLLLRVRLVLLIALAACLAARPGPAQEPDPAPAGAQEVVPEADEVLVIGRTSEDGVPEVPLDHPGQRDVLAPEEVDAIGARDLNDLIQHLPAVSTRPYNGGEAAAPSFSMRGLPDDGLTEYVHVAIDGTPAHAAPYGWTAFSFLPLAVERVHAVDGIRGGHQVRYSPNTVGGVINLITRPIPAHPELETVQKFGSNGFVSSFVTGGTTTDDGWGYRVSALHRSGDGIRRNGDFEQQDVSLELRQDLGDGAWFASSVNWFEDEHQAPGGLTVSEFRADRFANSRPENRFEGFRGATDFVWHEPLGGEDWVEWFGAFSATERHLFARRSSGSGPVLDDWLDQSYWANVGARAEHVAWWGGTAHRLHGGVRVHREWLPSYRVERAPLGSTAFAPRNDSSFRLLSLAAHLDDTVELTDRFEVQVGARAEWIPSVAGNDQVTGFTYEDEFADLLPAAGASWELTEHAALFANYGEGFRAPQFWGFAFAARPEEALDFEEGRSGEIGLRVRDLGGWSGSLAWWFLDFDEYLTFDTGFYENVGAIESRGVDLVAEWDAATLSDAFAGLSLTGNLTVQDARLATGPNEGNEVPYAWELQASWRALYQPVPAWRFSLGGVYVGETFSDAANTTTESADGRLGLNDAYAIWDAQVARSWWLTEDAELVLAAGATNLFDTEWEVHSRGGFFGPGLVAGAPRQLYGTVMMEMEW